MSDEKRAMREAHTSEPVKAESLCPVCNGNDADMPCLYPRENEKQVGCWRNKRLDATPNQVKVSVQKIIDSPEVQNQIDDDYTPVEQWYASIVKAVLDEAIRQGARIAYD